jgi:uncharacterized membrane protein
MSLHELIEWYAIGFAAVLALGVIVNLLPRPKGVPPIGYGFVLLAAVFWPITLIAVAVLFTVFILFGI